MSTGAPIGDSEFARLMAPFAPFETAPHLSVAVSGGADSLCLAWLAGRWARIRGGSAVGLVVDHGLRPDSAAEAAEAARQVRGFGMAARVLRWGGEKPRYGIQAAARAARYDLLARACREAGVLHLLLGHHAGDQAETVWLRRAAGSGAHGLAGMAAVDERGGVRLLRPLLSLSPGRLRATLTTCGMAWIEDPSNRDPTFARTLARRRLAETAEAALLTAESAGLGSARAAHEAEAARLLRQAARLDPRGFATIERTPLAEAPPGLARTVLARILRCIGGRAHSPRTKPLARVRAALRGRAPAVLTLCGCRIDARADIVTVTREAAPIPDLPLAVGGAARWDGRFDIALPASPGGAPPFRVRRLDDRSWGVLRHCRAGAAIPRAARPGLPVLHDLDGPVALPHLSLWRGDRTPFSAVFHPLRPLAGPCFAPAADVW